MTEALLEFENTVEDEAGRSWTAVVEGAEREEDRLWIGWIRFTPVDGGTPITTDRETTQPNRPDLEYWASGLTYSYLEGALERAQRRCGRSKESVPAEHPARRQPSNRPRRGSRAEREAGTPRGGS